MARSIRRVARVRNSTKTDMVPQLLAMNAGKWPSAAVVLFPAGLLAAVYCLMIFRRYVRIALNILDDYSPLPENGNGNGYGLARGEEMCFRASDGHRLQGVLMRRRGGGAPRGMVIFAHEFGSVRDSCMRYCESLLDAGFDLFSFDFRGHGRSAPETGYRPRHWTSDREKADMLGAIAHATSWLEEQGRPRTVGLFGISRGAGAAILAADESPDVRAIVVDGAFSSDTLIEYMLKRFATTFARIQVVARNHPPVVWRVLRWMLFRDCARRFNCRFPSLRRVVPRLKETPILFIHGERDSYIPVAQSEELHRLAQGPKELWIIPGAKHNQGALTAPREYARRIAAFYEAHLAAPAARPAGAATVRFQLPPITAGVEPKSAVFAGGALEAAPTR